MSDIKTICLWFTHLKAVNWPCNFKFISIVRPVNRKLCIQVIFEYLEIRNTNDFKVMNSGLDFFVPVKVPLTSSSLLLTQFFSAYARLHSEVFSPVMSHNSTYMNHFQDSGSVVHSGVGTSDSCLNCGDSVSVFFKMKENDLVVQSPAVKVL